MLVNNHHYILKELHHLAKDESMIYCITLIRLDVSILSFYEIFQNEMSVSLQNRYQK